MGQMGQVLFVVWRESVEALLVVGILYAWLKHGDHTAKRGLPYLWLGVALGVVAALGLGAVLAGFTEVLSTDAQDTFQTIMMLVASVLIVQMVLWIRQHGRTLKEEMEVSLEKNVRRASWWSIAALAGLAVAREGSETVIFLYGLGVGQSTEQIPSQLLAVALGFGLALLTFYVLQLGGRIFSWRRFFRVTELMLLFLSCGLLQSSLDKLIDREILPTGIDPLWNSAWLLDDASPFGTMVASLTGYRAHPSLTNVIVYVGFWIVIVLLRKNAHRQWSVRRQSA